jgi:Cd2+/Zn2+-exporting ATPase
LRPPLLKVEGVIALRDEIRPQAEGVMKALHRRGVKAVMLTGDNEASAAAVARELDIDEVRAGLKPEDKIRAVREMEERYGAVAMVGDGINDAPALASATLGIAMGTAGTDAAIEAADVALMGDDIAGIPYAIRLGEKARRKSGQNIAFSLLILSVLIPAALTGIMSVAVANGLRVARE